MLYDHFSIRSIVLGLIFLMDLFIQLLYDYNFSAFDLTTTDLKNDPQYVIDTIQYNKEDGYSPLIEMKYYVLHGDFNIPILKLCTFNDGSYDIEGTLILYGTINDYFTYADLNIYNPQTLRYDYDLSIIIEQYSLQTLYDYNLSSSDFHDFSDIRLQTLINEINFDKTNNSLEELKYFIYRGNYPVGEIKNCVYPDNSIPSVIDFSKYSITEFFENGFPKTWNYEASTLQGHYNDVLILENPVMNPDFNPIESSIYVADTSYSLLHFRNQNENFKALGNEISLFSAPSVKHINNLFNAQTFYNASYSLFDLHDTFTENKH